MHSGGNMAIIFLLNQLGTSVHKIVILYNRLVEKTDQIYVAQN